MKEGIYWASSKKSEFLISDSHSMIKCRYRSENGRIGFNLEGKGIVAGRDFLHDASIWSYSSEKLLKFGSRKKYVDIYLYLSDSKAKGSQSCQVVTYHSDDAINILQSMTEDVSLLPTLIGDNPDNNKSAGKIIYSIVDKIDCLTLWDAMYGLEIYSKNPEYVEQKIVACGLAAELPVSYVDEDRLPVW